MTDLEARVLRLEQMLRGTLRDLKKVEDAAGNALQQVGLNSSGSSDSSALTLLPAVLTSALAGGTLASPANATATLYQANSGSPSFTSGSSDTVYNTYPLTTPLAIGTQVWWVEVAGYKYVLTEACS